MSKSPSPVPAPIDENADLRQEVAELKRMLQHLSSGTSLRAQRRPVACLRDDEISLGMVVAVKDDAGAWERAKIVDIATWQEDEYKTYRLERVTPKTAKDGRTFGKVGLRSARDMFPADLAPSAPPSKR